MVGKNVLEWKDSNGKFVVKELIEVAKTKGEDGQSTCIPSRELAKPIPFKEKIPSKKLSYVYRSRKELLVVAACSNRKVPYKPFTERPERYTFFQLVIFDS